MSDGLPPLLGLAAFEAAARRGSFAEAGRELHLSSSAVSHRVKVLEQHLGAQLFERGARSLRLTDRGQAYLPVVQATLDGLQQGTAGVFGRRRRDQVTVRAPISYGLHVLVPRLEEMQQECDTRIELVSSIWGPGGVDVDADLSVEHEIEVAEPLGGPVAALLIARADPAGGPLRRVEVLGFEDLWADPVLSDATVRIATASEVRVDTWAAALSLVCSRRGWCALLPDRIVSDALQQEAVCQLGPVVRMRQVYGLRRRAAPGADAAADRVAGWLARLHVGGK